MAKKITAKQRKFVQAFLGEAQGNATKAAKLAGYGSPKQEGHRLTNADQYKHVQDEIAEQMQKRVEGAILTRQQRMQALSIIGLVAEKPSDKVKAIDVLNKMDGLYVQRHELTVKASPQETEEAVIHMYRANPDVWKRIKKAVEKR